MRRLLLSCLCALGFVSAADVTLSVGASDDGLPNPPGALSYTWSLLSKPTGATDPVINQSGPAPAPGYTDTAIASFASTATPGTYVFRCTVSDGALSTTSDVSVQVSTGNTAPSVTAAGATPSPVTGTTATLSATATDNGGEPALTYTWSVVSAPTGGSVSFSAAGTNAAKGATATFTRAGAHILRVTARDAGGLTATRDLSLTVAQTLTTIAVTPTSATVAPGATQAFTAQARDQFAQALTTQPTITWTVSGGGTIAATGVFTAGATAGGPHTVTAAAGGRTGTASITIGAGLPSPWLSQDIGAVAAAGSASHASGTWTVAGSGADIWGSADEFRYVHRDLAGDGVITARVVSLTNTNSWAKAGVMLRVGTAANAAHAMLVATPGNGVALQWRTTAGASMSSLAGVAPGAPVWVRLTRSGTTITAARSADGASWSTVGTASLPTGTLRAGLCVTSHADGTLATAVFDNVTVTGGANAAPALSAAAASPSPVTGTTATLSATATDDGGEPALTYAWSAVTVPSGGSASFSASGTNAAKGATATFTRAGAYVLRVTATDAGGLTAQRDVNVTVAQTLTTIALTPTSASVATTGTQAFSAQARDQFAQALATQPAFTWSVSGGGTISTAGVFTAGSTAGGPFTVTAAAGGRSGTASVTVTAPGGLPSGWTSADIGAVAATGSASHSNGTWTVAGSGADIWNTADEFRYAWRSLAGDGEITARVVSQTNTNTWAKAGVMIRTAQAANAPFAMMVLTPGNGASFQRRLTTGGSCASTSGAATAPVWVRLVRVGGTVTAYRSATGAAGSWTQVGTAVTLPFGSTALIGLAVTSHADGTVSTAVFDNVTVIAAPTGAG